MCGIAGIIFSDPARHVPPEVLDEPLAAIVHRGPDGEGRLVEPGIVAGMRRLSIIDLAHGDQPIFNEDQSVAVLFNGEIFNYRELRAECERRGHRFRTDSDTETLVHLYEDFGDAFVGRLNGMFAFVLWDRRRRRALLARDRYGIKPLYIARSSHGLAFASEVKSLAAMGLTTPHVSSESLGDYLRLLWIPEPRTMWKGVERVAPGTTVVVEMGTPQSPQRFFMPDIRPTFAGSTEEAIEELDARLRAAVERQLLSDVPVGALLSGGLDSSLIVAIAHELGARIPAHTTGISAADARLDPMGDDAHYAATLAQRLGLEHHIHYPEPRLTDLLPKLLWHADDPIADPAVVNLFTMCAAARPSTRVLLTGMGADEVAGGYRRHIVADSLRNFYRLPVALRRIASDAGQALSTALAVRGAARLPLLRRARKLAGALPADVRALPLALASWTSDAWLTRLGVAGTSWTMLNDEISRRVHSAEDSLQRVLAWDLGLYLTSHNLHYVDKMSMAASVEVRVPFLDNEFASLQTSLPRALRVRHGSTKIALRKVAERYLARDIIDRSKTGFAAPLRAWMSGPLQGLVQRVLSSQAVKRRGLFDPAGVSALLAANDRAGEDLSYSVWALTVLEVWLEQHANQPRPRAPVDAWPSVGA